MRLFIILVLIVLFSAGVQAQPVTIAAARAKAVGTEVTIKGIITTTEFGTQKYMQDNSAGMCLYDTKLSGVQKGDSVLLTGTLKLYNGELEVSPVSSFTVINTGNTLPLPKVLTFAAGFSAVYQGQVVQFEQVNFALSGTFQGNQNYKIYQSTVQEEARIKLGVDLIGTNIPTGKVTVIGIMSHFENYAGAIDQLLIRSKNDIILGNGPVINSPVNQINIEQHSFTVVFTTENKGNTMVEYGLTTSLELGRLTDTTNVTSHFIDLKSLDPATFYYIRVMSANASDTSKSNICLMSTASLSTGDIRIYFNNPVDTAYAGKFKAVYVDKALDDTLARYIGRAKYSIDMAIYNLNNSNLSSNISAELNNAAGRGVVIRVVYDGSTTNAGISELNSQIKRIASPSGTSYGIMHNKFIIFDANSSDPDDPVVWTGSMNITEDQINTDKNNVVIIQDQTLAKAYTLEFSEMFGSTGPAPNSSNAKFGPFKTDNSPHLFNVGGHLVELYFSPTDNLTSKIIDKISTADEDIYFATMIYTRKEIGIPMIEKFNSGVTVYGIIGDISGSNSAGYDTLKPWLGSNVLNYTGSGIFHHKYMIVDVSDAHNDPLVLTGSHNWSSSANLSNDENTLVIHDADIANLYFQEWAKRFKELGGTVVLGLNEENNSPVSEKPKAWFDGNYVQLLINKDLTGTASFILYDIHGRMLYQYELAGETGNNIYSIPVGQLSSGVYILKVAGFCINENLKILR